MGFASGGGGVLTNHTHDTDITNDGGALAANATMFGLSNQSMLVSDGTSIQELSIGSDGNNLTVTGGALSWEAHVAGDVLAGNLVMANSTTIGDYTQPASATCSSSASVITTPTYSNATFGAWATTGSMVTESSNVVTFDITTRIDNQTVSNDLGSTLSDSAWCLRCKLTFITLTAGTTTTAYFELGMGSANSSTGVDNSGISLDLIALQGYVASGVTPSGRNWGLVAYNSTGGLDFPASPEMDTAPTTQTYYLEIIRTSTTNMTIGLYDSDSFDSLIMPIETKTISSGVTGLQYLRVGNAFSGSGSPGIVIEGTAEDFQIWDGVTSPTTTYPCSNAVDDDVATSWLSTTETNPNIYVDMSSSTTTSNLALYPNTGTTETEIVIQSSDDAAAWTNQRTITWSNLTEGAWNYIRFNVVVARYWRIYGNSGNSVDMQIDEIKVLNGVSDADVRNLHGHVPISSSDTSLNNAGV